MQYDIDMYVILLGGKLFVQRMTSIHEHYLDLTRID